MTTQIVTYTAPDIIEVEGVKRWEWGERITWFLLVVDGEVVGRRRSREELSELMAVGPVNTNER